MTELEDALASLLTEVDEPTTKLSERELSRRVHSLIEDLPEEQRQQVPTDLLAEHMAFTFQEDHSSESTGWGTYYGPLTVMKNEQGEWCEWPSIQKVSKEI